MRVITGKARGVQLKTPDGMLTRPTTDRVKEALFSVIQFDIPGSRVLDLFGGTGQLGIEALSRGAKSAVFVDAREDACKLIRENLKRTRLQKTHGSSAAIIWIIFPNAGNNMILSSLTRLTRKFFWKIP